MKIVCLFSFVFFYLWHTSPGTLGMEGVGGRGEDMKGYGINGLLTKPKSDFSLWKPKSLL